jgi:hypothetical protein
MERAKAANYLKMERYPPNPRRLLFAVQSVLANPEPGKALPGLSPRYSICVKRRSRREKRPNRMLILLERSPPQPAVQRVPQGIPDEVESQDGKEDG